jgi:hypothetical protein
MGTDNRAVYPVAGGSGGTGEPAEVASVICRLRDGAQARVMGQVSGVDGGLGNLQAKG